MKMVHIFGISKRVSEIENDLTLDNMCTNTHIHIVHDVAILTAKALDVWIICSVWLGIHSLDVCDGLLNSEGTLQSEGIK